MLDTEEEGLLTLDSCSPTREEITLFAAEDPICVSSFDDGHNFVVVLTSF